MARSAGGGSPQWILHKSNAKGDGNTRREHVQSQYAAGADGGLHAPEIDNESLFEPDILFDAFLPSIHESGANVEDASPLVNFAAGAGGASVTAPDETVD